MINWYALTEDDSSTSKDIFYAALRKQFNTEKTWKAICIGDFNAASSATWFNSSLREHVIIDNLEINNNGERFHNFFNTQKLSVLNTWFSHRKCRRITWNSPDGNTKKIYNFILSSNWIRQYVTNCRVHNSYDFDSDHHVVVANLKTPCSKLARYVKRTKKIQPKQFDLSALKIPEIGNDLRNEAINEMNSINLETDNSTLNKNLLKSINDAALNNLPKKANVKLHQPWHNDEKLKLLYELKDRLIRENSNASSVKATRKKIRLRAKYLKNEYLKQEASEINQLAVNRKLEQLFKRAKSQSTTLKHAQNSCEVQILIKHFKTHFNPYDPSKLNTPN